MENKFESQIVKLSKKAREIAYLLQSVSAAQINKALLEMAKALHANVDFLKKENDKDVKAAREKGLSPAMIDRLILSDKTLNSMTEGLKVVAKLPSPIGQIYDERVRPNDLKIYKVKVPIGVVGIIYESRPNVTIDAAAICLKSKNAVILRGGSESFHSNMALTKLFSDTLKSLSLPQEAVQIVPTTDREAINVLLKQENYIDLIIPRGGESLIRMVVENSHIPVIKHYKGVCHVYVSSKADINKAIPIIVNAKVQRPGVCNAMETLLIDKKLSSVKREQLINALLEKGVELYGDKDSQSISSKVKKASIDDWYAEYLDLRCAVRCVDGVQEAIDHINTYGSHHTDAIISESKTEINQFTQQVDSSSVMINASTRFADGGEYGMGCEIGISTDKLHSRGPMGIEDLTTYKWIVEGNGQIRI